jgi:alanine racemase
MHHKTKIIIDLNKIKHNFKYLSSITKAQVSCVAKSDCYGLGMVEIAPALIGEGCGTFFVMSLEEGINLRKINDKVKIFVLYGIFENQEKEFIEYSLIPIINSLEQFKVLIKTKIKNYSLHIDTGMNRSGFQIKDFLENIDFIINSNEENSLHLELIMSHLACSEFIEDEYNKIQLTKFKEVVNNYNKKIPPNKKNKKPLISFANSGGIFLGSEYHFDLVRPGASIYGIKSTYDERFSKNILKPIRYVSEIMQVFEIDANESIGYNRTYLSSKKRMIATIAAGFADKFPRNLSNKWSLEIHGHKAPIVGNISMNLINIDVTNVPKNLIFLGQEVDLISGETGFNIINEFGGFNYEFIVNFGYTKFREYIR